MAFTIDSVFVWVNDLDQAIAWYSQLGIDAGPRYGVWQTMELDGQATFALHEGERQPGASTGAVAFRVPVLDKELTRLKAIGIHPITDITDTGAGRFAQFQDPDGNDVQLIER